MDSKSLLIILGILLVGYMLYSYNMLEQNTALMLTGLVLAGFLIYNYYYSEQNGGNCKTCVQSHSQHGDDYVWLDELGYGKVSKVQFEEPVGSGKWTEYDDKWWDTHCKAVSHNPNDLLKAHVDAFVDPSKRFARMMFTFQSGVSMEPTKRFFELEQNYFKNINLC